MGKKNIHFQTFIAELLVGLVAVILFLLVCDRTGAFSLKRDDFAERHRWQEFYELGQGSRIDALVLGNSHGLSSLNCETLSENMGLNFFALGHEGAKISGLYWTLHHALNYVSPELVCLETKSLGFDEGFYKLRLSIHNRRDLGFRSKDASTILGAIDQHGFLSIPFTLFGDVFRYPETIEDDPYATLLRLNDWRKEPEEWKTRLGIHNIYKQGLHGELLEGFRAGNYGRDFQSTVPNDEDLRYLDKLIALCRGANIELLFYESPYFVHNQLNLDARHSHLFKVFHERGVPWVNFSSDTDLTGNPNFFHNSRYNQHMTVAGAEALTEKLTEILASKAKVSPVFLPKTAMSEPTIYGDFAVRKGTAPTALP